MSCAYCMRAFDTGYLTDNNKPLYFITKRRLEFIFKPISKSVAYSQHPSNVYTDRKITEYIEIPCGECEQCQARRAKQWTERCVAEAQLWKHNVVINLTYDDENLPKNRFVIDESGERVEAPFETPDTFEYPTLKYSDVQKFLKDLRRYWKYHYNEDGIRFVQAGEYGDKRGRPHYHLIMFNLNVRDLEDHGTTPKGGKEFLSKTIQKIWNKGWVTLGEVTRESIQYIANYTLKKIKGHDAKAYYQHHGKYPEFIQSSRNPGIGAKWLDEHKEELLEYGKVYIGSSNGVMEIHSSSYLDRKLSLEDPERLKRVKEIRKNLFASREATRARLSGVDVQTQRENEANAFHERIKYAKHRSTL